MDDRNNINELDNEREANEKEAQERWDKLDISNDFIFGKVMQDAELCKELLQMILPDLDIERIEYPELQKTINTDIDAKSIRLDVYVRDEKGTVYDIEMQVVDTKELPKRTRYYQSVLDLQLIEKGEHYSELKPSYIIFICTFDFFKKGRHVYTFENICKEDKEIFLGDETSKIFLNAKGSLDDVSDKLKVFLDYVAGKRSEDTFVKRLDEAVKQAKLNVKWRKEYMTWDMEMIENRKIGEEKMIINALQTTKSVKQTSYILQVAENKVREIAKSNSLLVND